MKLGKLRVDVLERLLQGAKDYPDVIQGPSIGVDAAAVRVSRSVVVAAADPVTFVTDRIGQYVVSVNANDIAVMGAEPKFFLATILLPPGATQEQAVSIFTQVRDACEELGVALIGGHTEITDSVTRPVVSGCMFGSLIGKSLITSAGATPGNSVILANPIAIEGTTILAREAKERLLAAGVGEETLARAEALIDVPGICVVRPASIALAGGQVTAMHDPTEGGLATALWELAAASNCGLAIDKSAIPILPECREICRALGLYPMGLIASGSLLIACGASDAGGMVGALSEGGFVAAVIGEVVPPDRGLRWIDGSELPHFERDEIARFFEENV